MFFAFGGTECYAEVLQEGSVSPPLLLVHGFAGTLEDWRPMASSCSPGLRVAALDLPGFGKSGVPGGDYYSAEALTEILSVAADALRLEEFILVGYSMGGRAALHYAVKQPPGLRGVVLLSASAGIASAAEREDRRASDEELISYIEHHSEEEFAEKWLSIPLFSGLHRLPQQERREMFRRKAVFNKQGLINSLRGFGQGVMPPLHDALQEITQPVLLLSGEEDEKYCRLNKEMEELLPMGRHETLPGASHVLHLEKPAAVAKAIMNYFNLYHR